MRREMADDPFTLFDPAAGRQLDAEKVLGVAVVEAAAEDEFARAALDRSARNSQRQMMTRGNEPVTVPGWATMQDAPTDM